MFNNLNKRWQDFITRRHKQKIITISSSKERTDFFNFLIKSRNIAKTNQQDMVSTLIQALEVASTTPLNEIAEEMEWYEHSTSPQYVFSASPITLTNQTSGFEYSLLD